MRSIVVATWIGLVFHATGCSAPGRMTFHIEPSGGEARYADPDNPALLGSALIIPAGALERAVDLQIGPCDNFAAGQQIALGPCVRFVPQDLVFAVPVTLTTPYNPDLLTPELDHAMAVQSNAMRSTIGMAELRADPESRTIAAAVKRLGDYQAVATASPPPPPTRDVDVLFLVDNTLGAQQKSLVKSIPGFMKALEDLGVNYHIGIATSDVGATVGAGKPWGGSIGSCDTFEGDNGVLQNLPCTARSNITSEARNACAELCPNDRFVPTDGKRYISKVDGITNVPPQLVLDPQTGKRVDVGPINAFKCMALVGDGGCGIEAPLEGARRALDPKNRDNAGFLRPNSMLAIIFVTDEDDCSVQLSRRSENNPQNRDCADPDQNASYDCYNVDYRCVARSVQCNEPMNTPGPKTGCKERAGNYLEPTSKYVSFFRSLRSTSRLLVSGLWTLPSIEAGGKLVVALGSGTASPFLNRATRGDASCAYPADPWIFGQAQFRLSKFAAGFGKDAIGQPHAVEASICDLDSYESALQRFTDAIASKLKN